LDVGATEYIRSRLLERREKGVAVLLVSKDLEEIGLMMAGSRPLSAEAVQ